MKTFLSLVIVTSLFLNQFASPLLFQVEEPMQTPSETPSATPEAKETPEVTATRSPSETAIPIPEAPIVPMSTPLSATEAEAMPSLVLRSDPDYIASPTAVSLFWEVNGIPFEKGESTLQISIPAGVVVEDRAEGKFDESAGVFSTPIYAENGGVPLQVESLTGDMVFYASVQADNGEILAETKLVLPIKEAFILDDQGGILVADEGRIKIEIPENALSETSSIAIGKPSGDSVPPFSLSGDPFEITARGEASKEEQTQFPEEITISVSYAELDVPETLEGDLTLYWYNPETKDWDALPTTVNPETKILEAYTDHFTVFDMDVNNWQASRLPTVDSFQVSNFTGAATYALPIEVPAGPGGFQPNFLLTYNSQIVDQSTTATQATWVGMGWSLDTGSIDLDSHGTGTYTGDDSYLFNVAGMSTRFIKDSSGVYHAMDENF